MLKNYLKIAYRNLKRNKGYTIISISGLAVGMACCMLIFLYVHNELSYDDFNKKAEHIYRINLKSMPSLGYNRPIALTPNIVGPLLEREFAGVKASVRMYGGGGFIRNGNRTFQQAKYFYVDSTFFNIFTFSFIKGDTETALNRPNTVVLTESAAKRYFDGNPIGETLILNNDLKLEVTGVIKDVPPNSHFDFDFLVSWTSLGSWYQREKWSSANFYTYVLLDENVKPVTLQEKIDRLIAAQKDKGKYVRGLSLMPLTKIHLSTNIAYALDPTGNIRYIYIFSAIAVLILLIAGINYMNLATARAMQRVKEVGVRKTTGAVRSQLAGQFLMESTLISIVAGLLALVLARLALPVMNSVSGKMLNMIPLFSGWTLVIMAGLVLLAGLLSGSYPAFVLSGVQPAKVLKGTSRLSGHSLRQGLVVFQFAVSIALIVGTVIIQSQLDYLQNANLGLDKKHVAVLHLTGISRQNFDPLEQAFLSYPGIQSISLVNQYPGALGWTGSPQYAEGVPDANTITVKGFITDGNAVKTLGLKLIAGHDFRKTIVNPDSVENSYRYLLNETLVQALGWTPDQAIGKRFAMGGRNGKVIGVVTDFHFASLRQVIEPLAIWYNPDPLRNMLVRFAPGALKPGPGSAIAYMKEKWAEITPLTPFRYSFLNNVFNGMYKSARRFRSVFSGFAILAIFIACLGLFGLATLSAERRTKEIGIRKVMGATVTNIVGLLSKDFIKLVAVGFVIAVPIGWYAMHRWLQSFAYKVHLSPWIFILAGAIALFIALATVSWQSIRAALANPVDSLRSE